MVIVVCTQFGQRERTEPHGNEGWEESLVVRQSAIVFVSRGWKSHTAFFMLWVGTWSHEKLREQDNETFPNTLLTHMHARTQRITDLPLVFSHF